MIKRIAVALLAALCLFGAAACKSKKPGPAAEAAKEWFRYISAFTSGAVSRKAAIRVLFVGPVAEPGPAAAGLLDFSPSIAGAAEWRTPRELVFTPKGELEPGREYKAVINVGKVLDLPKGYARFEFGFSVIRPGMLRSVQVAALQIYPGNMAQFFQVNSLEGANELARVGRYLWRKTIPLSDNPAVTGRWSRYGRR
jgi:hypothetical protein